ncbi:unnamed protein product, partial [Ranitomeya imitator]
HGLRKTPINRSAHTGCCKALGGQSDEDSGEEVEEDDPLFFREGHGVEGSTDQQEDINLAPAKKRRPAGDQRFGRHSWSTSVCAGRRWRSSLMTTGVQISQLSSCLQQTKPPPRPSKLSDAYKEKKSAKKKPAPQQNPGGVFVKRGTEK